MSTLRRAVLRYAPDVVAKRALARQVNRVLRDRPKSVVTTTRFGARVHADTQDLIQRYVHMFGTWEPHMTSWLRGRLRPGDVFVDIGANIGYFTLLAAPLVGPRGGVVAVEASPDTYRLCRRHVAENRIENVRTVNCAVSDHSHDVVLTLASSTNVGANSIVPYDGPVEAAHSVRALALPDILGTDEVARARVIKIDVEGAEGAGVRGMAPLLPRLRQDVEIAVEVTPDRMLILGDTITELLETMTREGFVTYVMPNSYRADDYPGALRRPTLPVRHHGTVATHCDLVFSRVVADRLA
ncbi:FkbM family methyltransferase [Embleya sp. NPDC001921]